MKSDHFLILEVYARIYKSFFIILQLQLQKEKFIKHFCPLFLMKELDRFILKAVRSLKKKES